VAGSGLIDPEARTRIGAMPEIGRPMMQRMITEPAAREQFAALETSRRAEELIRLRDLAPAVAEPAPSAEHDDQATVESAAPAPQPPSDTSAAPAASAEAEPPAVAEAAPAVPRAPAAVVEWEPAATAETAPAAVAPTVPGTDAAPLAVAIAEPAPPTAAEAAPDPAASTPEATTLAVEPAVDPPPAASPIAPPPAAPESVVVATAVTETPAAADHSEPPAEPPASAPQRLALAEPDAVPTPEPPAKLAARTGEPEEAAPIRRWVPRFVPPLPRIVPALSRLSPARLAHAPPRVMPILVRHVHARAKAEAGKQDIAKAAAAPKRPVRHWVRQVPHRAQRASVAPNTAVSPYPAYSVTSGIQYR
jgi:hypothetical protein